MAITYVHRPQNEGQEKVRLLETRYNFDAKSRMASAKFDYFYNYDLSHPVLQGRIGGQTLPDLQMQHGWNPTASKIRGRIFTVHPHDLNVTSVTDGMATFTFGSTFQILSLGGRELFRAEHILDSCGQVEASLYKMVKGSKEFKQTWKFVYDEDNQLESASMADNTHWRFAYDLRGQLVSLVTLASTSAGSTTASPTHKLNFDYDGNGLFKGKLVARDLLQCILALIFDVAFQKFKKVHIDLDSICRVTFKAFVVQLSYLYQGNVSKGQLLSFPKLEKALFRTFNHN